MESIKFYKSPIKGFLIIILSSLFVATGYWMIIKTAIGSFDNIMGWLCSIFFSVGIPAGLFTILDRRPYLEIRKEGLKLRGIGKVINWEFIEDIYIKKIYYNSFLCIQLPEKFEAEIRKTWFGQKSLKIDKELGFQAINFALTPIWTNPDKLFNMIIIVSKSSSLNNEDFKSELKKLRST